MVKSLAGLDIYLQHYALPGDTLIIDEPEMNAHPRAQCAIIEMIAAMVNAGLRVTLTTHSPYIVDHLMNLIEAAELPEDQQDAIAPQFRLATPQAFVKAEKVAVYLFDEQQGVESIFDSEQRIIDWSTFGRESEYIASLYNDILKRMPGG